MYAKNLLENWENEKLLFWQIVPKEMINKLDSYDIILLSRYIDGGGDKRSKMRILSSKIINLITASLFSAAARVGGCSYKMEEKKKKV